MRNPFVAELEQLIAVHPGIFNSRLKNPKIYLFFILYLE